MEELRILKARGWVRKKSF